MKTPSLIRAYFKFGPLVYLAFILSSLYMFMLDGHELSLDGIFAALVGKLLPVWLSFHFAGRMERDSHLVLAKLILFVTPLLVIGCQVALFSLAKGPVPTFLGAFFVGGLAFAITFCLNLALGVFARD